MKRRTTLLLSATIALIATLVHPAGPAGAVGGSISGTVTDAATGDPLSGIEVTAVDASSLAQYATITASDGTFTVSSLPIATYVVRYVDPGATFATTHYPAGTTATTGTQLDLSTVPDRVGIDVALELSGAISGVVTDASTGTPLAGIEVIAERADLYGASAVSAADGTFALERLLPGEYSVAFFDPSNVYLSQWYDGWTRFEPPTTVTVSSATTTTGIDAAMELGKIIRGTVADAATGDPVPGVAVSAEGETLFAGVFVSGGFAITGLDGSYVMTGLIPDTHVVRFEDPSGTYATEYYPDAPDLASAVPVDVTLGDATGIDASLDVAATVTGRVRGRIVDDDGPVASFGMALEGPGTFRFVSTDDAGRFELTGIDPGTYRLSVFGEPFGSEVVVAAGDDLDLGDVNPNAGTGSLSGTVTDLATGTPLPNIEVRANKFGAVSVALTDAAGSYTLPALAGGSYVVSFTDPGDDYAGPLIHPGTYDLNSSSSVAITEGLATTGIDAQLEPGGTLAGTITDLMTGAPVAGVDVIAAEPLITRSEVVTTAVDGTWQMRGLPPGDYTINADDPAGLYATPRYYDDTYDFDAATPVTLAVGATVGGLDLTLAIPGSVTGTITDAVTGDPVAGAGVAAYVPGPGDRFPLASTFTAADGSYSLELPPTDVVVGFTGPGGSYTSLIRYVPGTYERTSASVLSVPVGGVLSGIDGQVEPARTISGTVTDASTGGPVDNVVVAAYRAADAESQVALAITGVDGTYALEGLPPDAHVVGVSDDLVISPRNPGYARQWFSGQQLRSAATVLDLTGGSLSGIDLALTPGGGITGQIVEGGAPISTFPYRISYSVGGEVVGAGTMFTADFELRSVPPGTYTLSASVEGQPDPLFELTGVQVSEGAVTSLGDIDIDPPRGVIRGVVTDASTGLPVEGLTVLAEGDTVGGGGGTTGPDGSYEITDLAADDYRVVVIDPMSTYASRYHPADYDRIDAGAVTVPAGGTVEGVDVAVELAASISGVVTDAVTGDPVPDLEVSVGRTTEVTGTDGSYTLVGLPPRADTVRVDSPTGAYVGRRYWPATYSPWDAVSIDPAPGQVVSGIDVQVEVPGRMSGVVTDSSTGDPIAGVDVTLSSERGFFTSATSAADGTYTIEGIPPGEIIVAGTDPTGAYAGPRFADGSYDRRTAGPITLSSLDDLTVDLSLEAGGSITGAVIDRDTGDPVEGVFVGASSEDGVFAVASTLPDGSYAIEGLPPGAYVVRFDETSGHYAQGLYHPGTYSLASAVAVDVALGEVVTGIDAQLEPGAMVSGRISDAATGDPVGGALVEAVGNSVTVFASASTQPDGSYTISGLPPGDYRVRASTPGGTYGGPRFVPGTYSFMDADLVAVGAASAVTGIDVSLEPGVFLSGTVTEAGSGAPVPGVGVVAQHDGPWGGETGTRWDGTYRVGPLPPGEYRIEVVDLSGTWARTFHPGTTDPATAVRVVAALGDDLTGVDVPLGPASQISGTITEAATGDPLGGMEVLATSPTGGSAWAVTRADGTYRLIGLPFGEYVVEVTDPSGVYADAFVPAGYPPLDTLTLADRAGVTGADAALTPGGAIAGRVLDGATPVAGLRIGFGTGPFLFAATTASDGTFVVDRVPVGTWDVVGRTDPSEPTDVFRIDDVVVSPGAVTDLGDIDVSAPSGPTVPGAPTGVAGVAGDGQVQVSWVAPVDDGGSPITGYVVTASPGGATCATGGATTCAVTGLTNGQGYTFTVVAQNSVGAGAASAPSGTVTPVAPPPPPPPPPPAVPGAPTGVTVSPGDGSIAVSWSAPSGTVTGYRATASPGGRSCATTGARSCVITGLENGTPYTVSVRASNAAGDGEASAPSELVRPRASVADPAPFSDVPGTAFYKAAVDWAFEFGITTGVGDTGTYQPDASVTRGQMVAFLWRLVDEPGGFGPHGFADVASGTFFEQALRWAKATGITTGVGGQPVFDPDGTVTRGQMVAFLWRVAGEPGGFGPHGFADVASGTFYEQALRWAKATGITTGVGGQPVFAPDDPVTRGQMATFLLRLASTRPAWAPGADLPSTVLF